MYTGVCVIDDDKQVTNIDDLDFAFWTWKVKNIFYCSFISLSNFKMFRMRIIGFEERTQTYQKNGSLWYGIYPGTQNPGYSMMVGSITMFHKAYLEMYFDTNIVPAEVVDYIDEIMNCDDLWLNIMISKFLGDISLNKPGALVVNLHGGITDLEGKACKLNAMVINNFTYILCACLLQLELRVQ